MDVSFVETLQLDCITKRSLSGYFQHPQELHPLHRPENVALSLRRKSLVPLLNHPQSQSRTLKLKSQSIC